MQVHGFRMSLWREQLGELNALYEHPGALACVQHVRKLTQVTLRSIKAFPNAEISTDGRVELQGDEHLAILQEVMIDTSGAPERR